MTEEDKSHHPRLLLLHEAGGEIEGRKKYHKLVRIYQRESGGETEIRTIREERGPFNPGLSKTMRRYIDLGLVEADDDGTSRDVIETEKGERYLSGFERTKRKLDGRFQETLNHVSSVIEEFGHMSGTELEQELEDDKESPYGKEYRD